MKSWNEQARLRNIILYYKPLSYEAVYTWTAIY